ncbi:MAG: hypothetical protein ACRC78_12085, partial [Planktothrix sp.]
MNYEAPYIVKLTAVAVKALNAELGIRTVAAGEDYHFYALHQKVLAGRKGLFVGAVQKMRRLRLSQQEAILLFQILCSTPIERLGLY